MKNFKKLIPALFVAILFCFASNTAKAQFCTFTIANNTACTINYTIELCTPGSGAIASGTVSTSSSDPAIVPCHTSTSCPLIITVYGTGSVPKEYTIYQNVSGTDYHDVCGTGQSTDQYGEYFVIVN